MTYIPAPSFILFCQLASCALYVKISAVAGVLEAENLEWEKSKKFALIVFGFIGTLFANVTSLRVSLCCAPFVCKTLVDSVCLRLPGCPEMCNSLPCMAGALEGAIVVVQCMAPARLTFPVW